MSWFGRAFLPEVGTYVVLGLAYVCIIGALYVDFSKIRKVRRAYQEEMMSKKTQGDARSRKRSRRPRSAPPSRRWRRLRPWRRRLRSAACSATGFRLPKKQEAEPMEAKTSDKDSTK